MASTNKEKKGQQYEQDLKCQHRMALQEGSCWIRKNNFRQDKALKCGNRMFLVHEFVLCAMSSKFRKMFEDVRNPGVITGEIEIGETSPEAVNVVINFMYTGELPVGENDLFYCRCDDGEICENEELLIEVIVASCVMDVPSLFDFCFDRFCANNPLHILSLWRRMYVRMYKPDCFRIMRHKMAVICRLMFSDIINQHEFLTLNYEQLDKFLRLLQYSPAEDKLALVSRVNDEKPEDDKVLLGILNWIKFDLENREDHLTHLLAYVCLGSVSPFYTHALLTNETLFKGNKKILNVLQKNIRHSATDGITSTQP